MNFSPSRDFLDCLGWTLLHFLWQGLVLAALLAVALRFLRRAANLRYLAGCAALLLMALAPVATFCSLHAPRATTPTEFIVLTSAVTDAAVETPQTAATTPPIVTPAPKPSADKITLPERLEAALPWLVAAWSLGVLALSCRLFAGWLFIQKLRRTATLIGPWQNKLNQLAARLRVSRPVRLLQSACIEVPTVIGWLRPVILLPASCLTGLTPAQLESILAHELAHIRRHDYLVNLLQNVVETLLFYHPAVWWVSRRIRAERENCCDDLAVNTCGDPAAYARALATLEELRPAPAPFALAASGSPLLERIRRLAGQPERSAVRPAWPVAGVIALLLLALLAVALRNNRAAAQPAPVPAATNQSTAPSGQVPANPLASQPSPSPVPTNSPLNGLPLLPEQATPVAPGTVPPAESKKIEQRLNYLRDGQTNASSASPSHGTSFTPNLKRISPPPGATPLPQINIKTKFAEIDASQLGTNSFLSFFGAGESNSLATISADFDFTEYYTVRPTNMTEPPYNVFFHNAHGAAPLATLFDHSQIKSAIEKLERQQGVDLLTAPEVTTESGRQCQIQAVSIENVVVGPPPAPTNSNSGNLPYKNPLTLSFGPVMDVIPHVSANRREINLTVIGSVTEFVGYEDPATVTNKDGKTLPKNWAIPRLRTRNFHAHVTVTNGQTLVLGAAPVPITTVQKMNDKVPILGDIPLIKPLFRSTKTSTNTLQKSLVMLVTPTLVNPDGSVFVLPAENAAGARVNPFNRTNLVHTSKGRQEIMSKLEKLRVDEVTYDHVHLSDVIKDLAARAKALDPDKIGINFLIARELPSSTTAAIVQIDPATGLPLTPGSAPAKIDAATGLPVSKSSAPAKIDAATGLPITPGSVPAKIDAATGLPSTPPRLDNPANIGSKEEPNRSTGERRALAAREKILASGAASNQVDPIVTIQPALKNVRLADVLKAITASSDVPIKYSILDFCVAFSLRDTNVIPLDIRTFHLDPKTFRAALESVVYPAAATNAAAGIHATSDSTNSPEQFQASIRNFLHNAGVDFSTNNPANVGKAIIWNERKGTLTIRATAEDLKRIESAVETLAAQRPLINFKVKVAEVTSDYGHPISFNWTQGNTIVSNSFAAESGAAMTTSGAYLAQASLSNKPPVMATVCGLLSEPQLRIALQALEQREGVAFLTAPETTAVSGDRRVVHANQLDSQKTGKSDKRVPAYTPLLDMMARASADQSSIELAVRSTLPKVPAAPNQPGPPATDMEGKPLPINLVDPVSPPAQIWITNNVTMHDGQTLVFSNLEPAPSSPKSSSKKNASTRTVKSMVVFVTATIVNPDGTPYHSKEQRASYLIAEPQAPASK